MFGFDNNRNQYDGRFRDSDWFGGSIDQSEQDELVTDAELKPAAVWETHDIKADLVDDAGQVAQRIKADFANYKRRVQNERELQAKCANKELILRLLPVLDDFSYALDWVPQNESEADWLKGVTLIKDKLTSILEREGVSKIDVKGESFDPHKHEAIYCDEDADDDEFVVKEVIKDGYKLHNEVIRPAQVIVSS
jgi:molecular chaperone GrpE